MDEHHADSNTGATRVSSIITLNLGPMMKPLGLIKIPIWVRRWRKKSTATLVLQAIIRGESEAKVDRYDREIPI